MKHYLIANRYALAFSAAITDDTALQPNLEAMESLCEIVASSRDFRSVLRNPSVELEQRAALLDQVLERIEAPTTARNLARTMLRRHRITLLRDVTTLFALMVDARYNRVAATVTTAMPLTPETEIPLQASLSQWTGRDVHMHCVVDPEILGGVVAEIESVIIDGSVRTRLNRLKERLIEGELPQIA